MSAMAWRNVDKVYEALPSIALMLGIWPRYSCCRDWYLLIRD